MPDRRPNILVFFSDQQRWDTCGCYGQELPVTPNLDRMAGEGVKFEYAFTCQPVCGPARACLQSGLYATQIGCVTNSMKLPEDADTIAKRLGAAGYATAYVGKWHLASDRREDFDFHSSPVPPERRGGYRDYWVASDILEFTSHSYDGHMWDGDGNRREFPEGRYRVDCVTDFVVDFLRGHAESDDDRPFLLFTSYIEPHHQNDHGRYEGPHGSAERWGNYRVPGDLADTGGDWRENYPDYLGCCNALDSALGRVRDELDRLGIADDTLILYTSDHGSHFCTRNKEYKRSCHESSIRVPMIACGPGFTGGRTVENLVSLIDVPRTILSAAGVEIPEHFQGRDLHAPAAGDPGDWEDEVFVQISESQVGRAIRNRRWKYSVVAPDKPGRGADGSDEYIEEYLYDLEADPHERDNLVGRPEYHDDADRLRERLKARMVAAGESEPVIHPPRSHPD